jgi:ABC-type glycerol-3-phosphate transport system substrate-binding protein
MKRNTLLILAVSLFVTALMVAGCAPATQAPTKAPAKEPTEVPVEPVTIQIFYPVAVDAPIAAILNGYIKEFEAANPDIHVEAVFSGGYGDVKTAIQTTIEGGGEPPALAVLLATDRGLSR